MKKIIFTFFACFITLTSVLAQETKEIKNYDDFYFTTKSIPKTALYSSKNNELINKALSSYSKAHAMQTSAIICGTMGLTTYLCGNELKNIEDETRKGLKTTSYFFFGLAVISETMSVSFKIHGNKCFKISANSIKFEF